MKKLHKVSPSALKVELIFSLLMVLLFYFSALPLIILVFKSLMPAHIGAYGEIIAKKSNFLSILNTLTLCSLTTLFAVGIGLPLAWVLSKTDIPRSKTWKTLFAIPYILPPYLGAIAWIKLCNPNSGILNTGLKQLFHLSTSPFNIYSLGGAVWVLGIFFYSFVFLSCYAAFERMDPSHEEAGLASGANRWIIFRTITFPLILPSLVAGIILVFMAVAASFGVPALLLMPQRIFVLTTKIYTDILSFSGGIEKATSLSTILMLIGIVGLWSSQRFLKNKRYTTITGKYQKGEQIQLLRLKWPVLICLGLCWGLMVLLPLMTIAISSFSIEKYIYVLFTLPSTHKAFFNSFYLASLSATIAIFIGLLLSHITSRTQLMGKGLLNSFVTLPYATPGTVIAMGLIIAFSGFLGINLYNTIWILVIAYVVKYLSFAVQNTEASFRQIDPSLEEAARASGAGWIRTFSSIVLPLLKPTLIASWFLIFMPTFSELTMSVLLVGPNTETIGTVLYNLHSYDDPQAALVLATIIVFVLLSSNLLVKKLTKGQYGI